MCVKRNAPLPYTQDFSQTISEALKKKQKQIVHIMLTLNQTLRSAHLLAHLPQSLLLKSIKVLIHSRSVRKRKSTCIKRQAVNERVNGDKSENPSLLKRKRITDQHL